ncbi:MAG: methyl-accepting chemotaxis protein [Phycisphaerae bacterium]|nr:methyl-accepting chemotaxis protein [Phycisphaerae bacterium]
MAIGFGSVVLIAAVLGISGWQGLSSVTHIARLNDAGSQALGTLDECAKFRRDFLIRGFTVTEGESKNAAEKWADSYNELTRQIGALRDDKGLSAQQRTLADNLIGQCPKYKALFEEGTRAQKAKDDAFEDWSKIGWEITSTINTAGEKVINPAMEKARAAQDGQALAKWSGIEKSLNEQVVQNFLLQRIYAVYLSRTNNDAQWKSYQDQLTKTKHGINDWSDLVKGENELERAATSIAASVRQYEVAGQQFYQGLLSERKVGSEMAAAAGTLVEQMNQLKTLLDQSMKTTTARTNTLLAGLVIAGVIIGIGLAVVITRSIVKPVNRIIAGLGEGAEQVSSAAGQVSSASQSLAEGATEQAAGLEETSSSLEEMASMTKQNADNAQHANTLASEARNSANAGREAMGTMNRAIQEIQKSSDETAKIIKVIDEIAFQTNLLALNAAVEAARAGEAGKGFAVVAEEVRNLAMRSAEAAKNTSEMIEGSVKNARNGVEIAEGVTKVLNEIVDSISKTTDLVGEIAAASQEQAQGIDQVNQAVGQMDKVTQANAANAEESASASEELTAQAEQLNDIVLELSALVGGHGAQRNHSPGIRAKSGRPARLSTSDHAFHQIAAGRASKKQGTPKAERQAIPLNKEEWDEFNS